MARNKATIYLDGKILREGKLPKDAKLVRTVNEKHYQTPEYMKQQDKNAAEYFRRQREMREDQELYHG
jgi:hypothetical protein